eukprot:2789453-Pyramimonas_sp.AAC.1
MNYLVAMFRVIKDALLIEGDRSPPESRTEDAARNAENPDGNSCATEARTRAKIKSLVDKPKEAKRQKLEIKNHFDDCGDDIKGLAMDDSQCDLRGLGCILRRRRLRYRARRKGILC